MSDVSVEFVDVDDDGDREIIVENTWIRMIIRHPEHLGEEKYGHRWSWGGRLQSLVYKPTGREFFKTEMIDPEDNRPFGLPDELFASYPMKYNDGTSKRLKMGVGVFTTDESGTRLSPLPWTWFVEENEAETAVVIRQEATDLGGYSFRYDKRYRFRPNAAWFAMDVVWTNNGDTLIASDWDIHSFHVSGAPPHSSWLVAPKRAWVTYGNTRLRTILKEPSAIFARPEEAAMVADRITWDLDGSGWWYALGPGAGDEFYLLNGRFEPYRGLFWHGWHAFTPQGINHVEVPPGDSAVWGFDVTLGIGGKHFVASGEDCGLTIQRPEQSNVVVTAVHAASKRRGKLSVHVVDQFGHTVRSAEKEGELEPGEPLQEILEMPDAGAYARVETSYSEDGRIKLHSDEIVPMSSYRPTAHLPFNGRGEKVFITVDPDIEHGESDGRYIYCHGVETGFVAEWGEPGVRAPDDLDRYGVIAIVGNAWPSTHIDQLKSWVHSGGGLLICAPVKSMVDAYRGLLSLMPGADQLQIADPVLNLIAGTHHLTADRLMLHPDANVKIGYWMPAEADPNATVTLRFTDEENHPACGVMKVGSGRVATLATRPAWGAGYRNAIWDSWGQYHRAFFSGLLGWLSGTWNDE